jgi:hypothetical protein
MAIIQFNWPLMRCLVSLRQIAAALERMAPPPPRTPRRAEFSTASREDLERGWDRRDWPSREYDRADVMEDR